MRKKFVSSLALLLLLNFLIKPLWIFGIDIKVQNLVGAESYGLYAALFSFTVIFNIVLDVGLSHYNNRAVSRKHTEVVRNLSYLGSLKLLLGIIYLMLTLAVGYFLQYRGEAFILLVILSINQFLASLVIFLRSNLAGLQLFKTDAAMSVLDKLLMVLACGLMLYTSWFSFPFTVKVFALVQTGSYTLVVLLTFYVVLQKAKIFRIQFNPRQFKRQLRSSMPYALLILLMALYTRVDSVMIQQITGAFENGIYAQAFRLLEVTNQVGYLFSVLLLPMFSGMIARGESTGELAQLAYGFVLVIMLSLGLGGFVYARPLMNLLYEQHTAFSAPIFKPLILSSIAFSTTYVFGTLLTARGNLWLLNKIAVGGFVLNIVLNGFLIPRYGGLGAAYATFVTQFGTALAQVWFCMSHEKELNKEYFWQRVLGFMAAAGIWAFGLSYISWPWYWGLLTIVVGIPLIAIIFRFNPVRPALIFLQSRLREDK